MNAFEKIYTVVALIPKGKVMTYQSVAKKVGTNPRVVGFALHANRNTQKVPCHRVIKSNGTLAKGYAFGGRKKQLALLKDEGITFSKGTVELKKFLLR